jgi:hypothetical protein
MCILRFYHTFIYMRKESWSTENFQSRVINQKLLIFLRLLIYNSALLYEIFVIEIKRNSGKLDCEKYHYRVIPRITVELAEVILRTSATFFLYIDKKSLL